MISFHPRNNHRAELRLKSFEARNHIVQTDLGVCPPNTANQRRDNPSTLADSKTATQVTQYSNPNLTQNFVLAKSREEIKSFILSQSEAKKHIF